MRAGWQKRGVGHFPNIYMYIHYYYQNSRNLTFGPQKAIPCTVYVKKLLDMAGSMPFAISVLCTKHKKIKNPCYKDVVGRSVISNLTAIH